MKLEDRFGFMMRFDRCFGEGDDSWSGAGDAPLRSRGSCASPRI